MQGQVVYKLKTAYRNGTTHIVLSPLDFLSRPGFSCSQTSSSSDKIPWCLCSSLQVSLTGDTGSFRRNKQNFPNRAKESKKSYSMCWAKMLKRVFDIDIQTCLKCGGQIKIISSIHNPQIIKKILTHLGENSTVPELSPPRGPPETEHDYLEPAWT